MGAALSAGGIGRRRGYGRAARLTATMLVAVLVAASGCGGSGHGAETDPEKGSDAAVLNAALARELTLLGVYRRALPLLRGGERAVGRQLRAEEQEYVDAVTKAIRDLGGDTEAEAEELDLSRVKGRTGFLALTSELESATVELYVDRAAQLNGAAPRTLDAWLAAGHGQHLALLPTGGG
jgi:Ferritin-like domain